jgi:hypothetical protein
MSSLVHQIIESPFWQAFWPNFTATIVGVALGIPIALWLDRRVQKRTQRERSADRESRLFEITGLLADIIRANADNLAEIANAKSERVVAFSELELASWTALHDDALDLISSIELKRNLTRHFEHVTRILAMQEQRTLRIASRLNQIRIGDDQATPFEEEWLSVIRTRADEAFVEALRLASQMDEVRKAHSGPQAPT